MGRRGGAGEYTSNLKTLSKQEFSDDYTTSMYTIIDQ
jgi:hypothetical protein